MTFSKRVKAELCRIPITESCCAAAEAYGALLYANTFTAREIRVITGSAEFAARLPVLFGAAFGPGTGNHEGRDGQGKISFVITNRERIEHIFRKFGYEAASLIAHHINLGTLEEACCRASFCRGAFLSGGSVTDPAKRYHLELVTDHMNVSRETYALLLEMGLNPKETSRAGNYVTYFKQSESIEDFLTAIGAPVSAMEIMEEKIEKDMRNAVNRRVNCDTANADKIVAAAAVQLDAIRRIEREVGIGELPDKLKETALLRIANPEASTSELAALSDPPVSKSCLNHRMKKLLNYPGGMDTP